MSTYPHACEIPILMQCEIWAEDVDRAVEIVVWARDRIRTQGLADRLRSGQVEIKLVQVAANESPTHIRIRFGNIYSALVQKADGRVLCPCCCGSGIRHWGHKADEVCVTCNGTGLLQESIYNGPSCEDES